jgi:oligopeptidase B
MNPDNLKPPVAPPVPKAVPKALTHASDTRVDNYFWMRDRKDPDTIAYLEAENAYTRARMQPTEALQAKLYAEMLGRIKQTDTSAPVRRGEYFYYTRTEEGQQYEIYCRRPIFPKPGSMDPAEEVLLDCNQLAQGHPYFRMGNFAPSPDQRFLAYSIDVVGDEVYTIFVKDLSTGQNLSDRIQNTYYSLAWANDNATFYYTTLDDAKRPYKVFRHSLGGSEDALMHHETDERFTVEVEATSSRAYILIDINSSLTSEVLYARADALTGEFRPVLPRVQGTEYDLTHHHDSQHGDVFYIRTNDGAKTFRLVRAPVSDPAKANWTEVIAGRADVTIETVVAFKDTLVVEERDRGLTRLRLESFAASPSEQSSVHYVAFDEPAYRAELGSNPEFDTPWLRYVYASLVTPYSSFDYHMQTRERRLIKQQEIPSGYDASLYTSERITAKAPDGAEVPISLVYKKGVARDGHAPLLLYGYGSYGISIDPDFRTDRLSLIDRGVVYAIAHIRGGGDLGKLWHENGRMLTKRNTFTDFIACAEHLVAEKYTSPSRMAIMGGSAGGLLMGAVANLRPDLFGGVVANVPFVDALTTELDASLPLTIGEWEEWGNPAEEKYYEYIKSYSPYDNVVAQEYPAMLVTAGLNDPRVSYWEPAKWVAKLRAMKRDSRTLLLKTNMGSGHFGASGRYEYLKETAFNYAFLLDIVWRM